MVKTTLSEAVNGANSGQLDQGAAKCPVCLGDLPSRRKVCSSRCRLLKWAVRALGEALKDGKAEGLREQVERLSAAPRLTVEVVHTRDLGSSGNPRNGKQER